MCKRLNLAPLTGTLKLLTGSVTFNIHTNTHTLMGRQYVPPAANSKGSTHAVNRKHVCHTVQVNSVNRVVFSLSTAHNTLPV